MGMGIFGEGEDDVRSRHAATHWVIIEYAAKDNIIMIGWPCITRKGKLLLLWVAACRDRTIPSLIGGQLKKEHSMYCTSYVARYHSFYAGCYPFACLRYAALSSATLSFNTLTFAVPKSPSRGSSVVLRIISFTCARSMPRASATRCACTSAQAGVM